MAEPDFLLSEKESADKNGQPKRDDGLRFRWHADKTLLAPVGLPLKIGT